MTEINLNPTERRNAAIEIWERWARAIVEGDRGRAHYLLSLRRHVLKPMPIHLSEEDAREITACSLVTHDWDDEHLLPALPEPVS